MRTAVPVTTDLIMRVNMRTTTTAAAAVVQHHLISIIENIKNVSLLTAKIVPHSIPSNLSPNKYGWAQFSYDIILLFFCWFIFSCPPFSRELFQNIIMYHAACKVEFQPFNRSYSQLTFFNIL